MYDYDDFYNEPSEFEMQIDEFKQSLLKTVKEEYKLEMERLRKENSDLLELKQKFDQIKQEYKIKGRALELEKKHVLQIVRKERLQDLLKDFEVTLYRPDYSLVKGPKCNRCNEERRIWFKDPLDRETFVDCPCGENKTKHFKPRIEICSSFENRNGKFIAWYKPYGRDTDGFEFYGSSNVPKMIYAGEEFGSIDTDYYNLYFKTEEECQAYCDWLTEKERNKES